MGLLDGGLQAVFGAAFGGLYLDGTLHHATRTETAGGGFSTDYDDTPIKVQIDAATWAMRQAEGATEKDVRLIVLQTCEGAVVAEPTTDDQITADGTRYALSMIDADPANTYWSMRGTPA